VTTSALELLKTQLTQRILLLDGGMGTMIQGYDLQEADYRGERFKDWPSDLKGNNDLLSLSQPHIIAEIHEKFLLAGADIIETNTFNANSISMADYDMQVLSYELNVESARIAKAAADKFTTQDPAKPRFVAGALGPTNRTASLSPDVNDPGKRNVTFAILVEAYAEATRGLIEGGVDLIMIETIFDTLNAKAAVFAVDTVFEEIGYRLPVMISGTITDASGRTLSGQTAEAFYNSMRHSQAVSFGLNCALGPDLLRQYVQDISNIADCFVSAYPNAGLPNEFGEYDLLPDEMAEHLREWAESGLVNIVGGCCGATPEHIKAIGDAVAPYSPRPLVQQEVRLRLSGLEPFVH